jgi:spore coat polysaccharide biosynthesis protein SpsF
MVEYFNPIPVEVAYRGHSGKLFKRDFASEFLDSADDWQPTAYGFLWKRLEPAWDNNNWMLMKRCA